MALPLVALHLPPADLPAALRRAWDDGAAVLPLPWDAPPAAIRRVLEQLEPTSLVTDDGEQQVPARRAGTVSGASGHPALSEDAALVVVTSGSTGAPKAVVLSHAAVRAATAASLERLGAHTGERFALALPLHHVAGLQVVLRAWACGTEPHLVEDPGDPDALAAAAGQTEHVSLVPTQLTRMLHGAASCHALTAWQTVLVGGAALTADVARAADAAGATVVVSYGMTETGGGCVYDGRPLDGIEVAIRPDRRIRVRGPQLCTGYLGSTAADRVAEDRVSPPALRPAADPDGWFTTADLGAVRDGRLEVHGRVDDVAITGGENVPMEQVAALLRRHGAVADAAVIDLPDPDWGTRLIAVVAARDPADPPDLGSLRDLVAQEHPPAYAPRALVLVNTLPRDAMGKLSTTALRELASRSAR